MSEPQRDSCQMPSHARRLTEEGAERPHPGPHSLTRLPLPGEGLRPLRLTLLTNARACAIIDTTIYTASCHPPGLPQGRRGDEERRCGARPQVRRIARCCRRRSPLSEERSGHWGNLRRLEDGRRAARPQMREPEDRRCEKEPGGRQIRGRSCEKNGRGGSSLRPFLFFGSFFRRSRHHSHLRDTL